MRSPFAIFRKNQKVLMVVLIGLSMFAFIFLDQLSQTGGEGLLPILSVMLGAGVFWVFGSQKGKATQYALTGALLGAFIGILVPRLGSAASGPVETNIGSVSEQELSQLVRKRQIVNQFLGGVMRDAFSESPFIIQFLMPRYQFGFGRPLDQIEEDVIFGYLLQHEADKLGIVVSDSAVSEYIKQATTNKLSEGGYRGTLKRLGVGPGELYDYFRDELKAKMAFQLLSPRTGSLYTPEQFWQDYRKINLTQSLEATAIPVSAFTDQVKEPSDSELQAFFDQYKNRFQDGTVDDEPRFAQPRRVRLAYVEADYETIEGAVADVTDEEIQKFYDENKETLYKIESIPGDDDPSLEFPPTDEKKPIEPEITPEKKESEKPKGDSKDEKPAAEKPVEKKSAEKAENKPAEKKSDTKKEAEKPEKPAAEKKKSDEGQARNETSKSEPELLALADSSLVLAQADTKKAESEKSDSEKTDTEDAKKAEAKKPATDAVKKDASEDSADKKETEKKPAEKTDSKPAEPAAPKLPELKESEPEVAVKYRPLDEDLKSDIRDQLLREKALAEMKKRIGKAYDLIRDKGFGPKQPEDDPEYQSAESVANLMKKFAEKNQLRYVETGLLSGLELSESDEHPIGQGTEPVESAFQRQGATSVVQEIFGTETPQLYTAHEAVDALTDSRFTYWTIEDVEAHVPTFDEPGVREQVLEAWNLKEARSAAEERAKKLAEIVEKADEANKTMEAALTEQTITGEKEGLQLTVLPTPEFSWFMRTQPSAPSLNPLQQNNRPPLELSRIPGIEKVGNDFMETVFDELQAGDVGVVANADGSVYYVVRVRNRSAMDPAAVELMRQSFLTPEQISSREQRFLSQIEQQQSNYEWAQEFSKKYGWDGQVHRPEDSEEN